MAYDVKGDKNYKLLPNILRRVKLRSGIRSGAFLFDNYDVKDGERPEDVAYKWFGDAESALGDTHDEQYHRQILSMAVDHNHSFKNI